MTSNRTKTEIKNINTFFENLSLQPLINNSDYKIALLENPNTDNEITKDYSGYYLRDFHFATSSNSIICNKLYDGFINIDIIDTILKNGARVLTLDIFSDSYCSDGMPIVSKSNPSKFYNANDPGTFNYLNFSDVCLRIKDINNSLPNNRKSDPLFLILKLQINNNNIDNITFHIAKTIKETFNGLLLCDNLDYCYGRTPLANIPIEDTFNKVVILAGKGFKGTNLEELITYSWEEKSSEKDSLSPLLFNSYYTSIEFNQLEQNQLNQLFLYNKKGMSFIDSFSGISKFSLNYNIDLAWLNGCQFIGVDYTNKSLMKKYIKLFTIDNEVYSIVLKSCPDPSNSSTCSRFIQTFLEYNSYQNPEYSIKGRKIISEFNDSNLVI